MEEVKGLPPELAHITDKEELRRELIKRAIEPAKDRLLRFAALTLPGYKVKPHHRKMAEALQKVEAGEVKRLMLFLPPRHGKSELSTIRFPAWCLGRNPKRQIIVSAYNTQLATNFGGKVRDLVDDVHYHAIFPDGARLKKDTKAKDEWHTEQGGVFLSSGIGGGITGYGADLAIIDDPFKDPSEAHSKIIKDNVYDWYWSALYTRLMPGGAIILILTRWAEDDLAGRLLRDEGEVRDGGDWTVIRFPAICERADDLGRQPGDALWPERYSVEYLEKYKKQKPWFFEALYQQNPLPDKGNIFMKEWWQYYDDPDMRFEYKLQSWDTAFEEKEEADYSVCTTWGYKYPNIYLVDRYRKQMAFPELKKMAKVLALKHRPRAVLVEKKSSGHSLIQELRRETNLSVVAIQVDRSKTARAHACTDLIQAERVYLPSWETWVDDYVGQLAMFPKGQNDDDVDSTTLALNYLAPYVDTWADEEQYGEFDEYYDLPGSGKSYKPNNASAGY